MPEPPRPPGPLGRTIQRIIVTADQITQRDPRPWKNWSLLRELSRYVILSAILVTAGVVVFSFLVKLLD